MGALPLGVNELGGWRVSDLMELSAPSPSMNSESVYHVPQESQNSACKWLSELWSTSFRRSIPQVFANPNSGIQDVFGDGGSSSTPFTNGEVRPLYEWWFRRFGPFYILEKSFEVTQLKVATDAQDSNKGGFFSAISDPVQGAPTGCDADWANAPPPLAFVNKISKALLCLCLTAAGRRLIAYASELSKSTNTIFTIRPYVQKVGTAPDAKTAYCYDPSLEGRFERGGLRTWLGRPLLPSTGTRMGRIYVSPNMSDSYFSSKDGAQLPVYLALAHEIIHVINVIQLGDSVKKLSDIDLPSVTESMILSFGNRPTGTMHSARKRPDRPLNHPASAMLPPTKTIPAVSGQPTPADHPRQSPNFT